MSTDPWGFWHLWPVLLPLVTPLALFLAKPQDLSTDFIYSASHNKNIMSNQNELSLEELQAISGGVKEGGCIVIRPCFPVPNCPMPTDYPNPKKNVESI